jgi:hypothetical protein
METSRQRIVGIYDADSTLWGEVSYWIGARLGRRHCSLCDVTHGMFTKKRSWDDCAAQLSHPFVTYHRNDMPDHLRPIVGNSFPVIVFDDVRQPRILLTDSDITGAKGSPESLVRLIGDALAVLPPQS